MGLTKYLCKKFDKRNKGYVTLEDVANKIVTDENIYKSILITAMGIVATLILCLIGEAYNYGFFMRAGTINIFDLYSISNFVTGVSITIVVAATLKILYVFWNTIKTSKIAVCSLKENK